MKTLTLLITALTLLFTAPFLKGFSADKKIDTDVYEKTINFPAELFKIETEDQLQLDPWMTNDAEWKFVSDKELEIAPWMTNDVQWKLKGKPLMVQDEFAADENLAIEPWMTDDLLWLL